MKFIQLFLLFGIFLYASVKTPSDVYSQSIVLKQMVEELRKENGITKPLKEVEQQHNKLPRHVIQKTLEVLTKVNKYREIHNFGPIAIPPVPPRKITPQDVYNNVIRLKEEIHYLLKNQKKYFAYKQYKDKTPSDVYQVLWTVSLGFDELLGQGFTPSDVYIQSQQILERIEFLRSSQREYSDVKMPPKRPNLHPNHALYASIDLIKKISEVEKKLWMTPVPVPKAKHKVISPTEVYDSLQTVKAELNRLSRRLGIERSFPPKKLQTKKTPSDVVQNLEYAKALLPAFDFSHPLNQYPQKSLTKTPNEVYALSEYILHKIMRIKERRGIQLKAKKVPYVYGLEPIYVYVKGLEDLEKTAKLKSLEGFYPSQIPDAPNTKITPSEVYELILRLDDEINLVYNTKKYNYNFISYRNYLEKKIYQDKTPSDVYNLLWKISYELDTILNQEYTPNETYILAVKLYKNIQTVSYHLTQKQILVPLLKYESKAPSDVFMQSLQLMQTLTKIKKRGNLNSATLTIPRDKIITPNSVYNALRLISGTVSELRVYYNIQEHTTALSQKTPKNKTPSDVFSVLEATNKLAQQILKDSTYAY
ncbi:hypothetical protein [Sulfurimonas hydrogeniphila]|uniref:hypothetical protein n=1 Tax=Sulfurimonas hydrogeniphila TaxID=2509341 RepID=UPI00125F692C|nr:hypothetical protein [Sulfurimonas hydrogeniphila]